MCSANQWGVPSSQLCLVNLVSSRAEDRDGDALTRNLLDCGLEIVVPRNKYHPLWPNFSEIVHHRKNYFDISFLFFSARWTLSRQVHTQDGFDAGFSF